jgi:hypothetical protein
MVLLLIYAGLCAWYLTRLDQESRDWVESRRKQGKIIPDFEKEVQKVKLWGKLLLIVCMIGALAGALSCGTKLLQ